MGGEEHLSVFAHSAFIAVTRAIQSHSHRGTWEVPLTVLGGCRGLLSHVLRDEELKKGEALPACALHWADREKPYSEYFKMVVHAGGAKKVKEQLMKKEILNAAQGDNRSVQPQPFALRNSVVWEQGAKLNVCGAVETVHHMLAGGLLKEAAEELCSLDGVCSQLLVGEAFNLI